jgi:hypothetical protein
MKTTLIVLCVFCAAAAFGQSTSGTAVLSNVPQMVQFTSNPQHASHQSLAETQSLLSSNGYSYAQGERPLWEMMPEKHETPLGDVARAFRQEHMTARKAIKTLDK